MLPWTGDCQDGQRQESPPVASAARDPGQVVALDGNPSSADHTTAHCDLSRKIVL
jgi:hypothetical protein